MLLYRTQRGVVADPDADGDRFVQLAESWDSLIATPGLPGRLAGLVAQGTALDGFDPAEALVPLVSQEVWAAGVTYYRSRDARMAESEQAGGDSFYDRVYTAPRPELFFKGSARTAVGSGGQIAIRSDAGWNVPEPELVLLADSSGALIGCTIGNDVSSRDIEGENPLYLPQAKVYDASCALGPALLVGAEPLPASTSINLEIRRGGAAVFTGTTTLAELKRTPEELLRYLYLDNSFPHGCYLMTGTGIVPPDGFTLTSGDTVSITIPPIGTLTNQVR
jgi:2-dehydro-3-deoxy-D-arabinonate dehydratase